jgi:MFS family permease
LLSGCAIQFAGLAGFTGLVALVPQPDQVMLVVPLTVFGYGQGRVMAPLFGLVLSSVAPDRAGAASGTLSTVQQIAAAVGISLAGLIYFTGLAEGGHRVALLASLAAIGATLLATAWLLWRAPSSERGH